MKTNLLLSIFAGAAIALVACSSSSNDASPSSGSSGPPIAADQVGSACSGVGTSPGDVAVFEQSDCPAGFCVADARTDFDTYCTAACDSRTCPDGYTCEASSFGDKKKVCLKDGSATGSGGDTDAGTDAAKSGPIGTKTTTGTKRVDADLSTHGSYTCNGICTKAGGTCNDQDKGNGVGWVDRKDNDGGGSFGYRIDSCDESEAYSTGTSTTDELYCYCDDMPAPPTVKVLKSDGLFTCAKVCSSWSMTCSTERESYAYTDPKETSSPKKISCATAPGATTDHYVCACDP